MVADNVELQHAWPAVAFNPVSVEEKWVAKLVAQGQSEAQTSLLPKAVQHVKHRAAGRLMGLQEHDVGVGSAGAIWGAVRILRRQGEDGAGPLLLHPAGGEKNRLGMLLNERLQEEAQADLLCARTN